MNETPSNKKTITAGLIVAALFMLIGIILLVYSQFQNKRIVLYIGLIMTLAGVLIGILRIIIHSNSK